MKTDPVQFPLRMTSDLRDRIEREAKINGRSINSEINARISASLDGASCATPNHIAGEETPIYGISDNEKAMLTLFRRWAPDRQLAFLVLFK